MTSFQTAVVLSATLLAACAHTSRPVVVLRATPPCGDRATQIISANVSSITSHRYAQASRAAEQAARVSLSCADAERSSEAFGDRWRGANALVVAAELAHEANDTVRARRLLHEGYTIMHGLRPPHRVNEVTSSLIAEKLGTARQDLAGQWAYW